jgi:hypothetical protein
MGDQELAPFSANRRTSLFLEMASGPEGTTVADVYRRASALGDDVTQEAYYNLARRLAHRGLLKTQATDGATRYSIGADADNRWLEEEDLVAMIDPEYPLLALPIWAESRRQVDEIAEDTWAELRERLKSESAPSLFFDAIVSYCDDFHAQIAELVRTKNNPSPDLPRLKQQADGGRRLLERMAKFGLGLSEEAVHVPLSVDVAISEMVAGTFRDSYVVSPDALRKQLGRRVANEPFIVDGMPPVPDRSPMIGAVDGSTQGGMLNFLGDAGDLTVGHAPMISINTAVGQVNRSLEKAGRRTPVFVRLPERPEDMQRQDNRYSIMAKLFFPDLSDSEYMHSVWNAMDLMEARATLRLLTRWYSSDIEISPADVVLRDGTVSPQDRDFRHYRGISSYEKIVRDSIDTNWQIAAKAKENEQTIAGIVKAAQLSVFGPVINWYAAQLAMHRLGQIVAWPIQAMNLIPDQAILTRLLTAKRAKQDVWNRSCVTLRPFYALTNFAKTYSTSNPPGAQIREQHQRALRNPADVSPDELVFWQSFRPESDPYLKMLEQVSYGNMFVGAVPRLDLDNSLPRIEYLVTGGTSEHDPHSWDAADRRRDQLLTALRESKFQVAAEHEMFRDAPKLDVLPTPIIRVHDTVKQWAAELLSRVQEHLSSYLSRYVKSKQVRRVKVRPFTRAELEMLYEQLKQERELRSGNSRELPRGE